MMLALRTNIICLLLLVLCGSLVLNISQFGNYRSKAVWVQLPDGSYEPVPTKHKLTYSYPTVLKWSASTIEEIFTIDFVTVNKLEEVFQGRVEESVANSFITFLEQEKLLTQVINGHKRMTGIRRDAPIVSGYRTKNRKPFWVVEMPLTVVIEGASGIQRAKQTNYLVRIGVTSAPISKSAAGLMITQIEVFRG